MAKAKVNLGGQIVKMSKAQAISQGLLDKAGMPGPRGQSMTGGQSLDQRISQAPGNVRRAKEAQEAKIAAQATPTNPGKQTQMFGTVQTASKLNQTSDIMNMDPNQWKKLQQKFGIKEV